MYLFLNIQDSKSIHPNNIPLDFTVELPQPITLTRKSRIALIEINYPGKYKQDLYVFCDICDYNYVKNGYKPLLRIVNGSQVYRKLLYIPLSTTNISRIRVYIRDEKGRIPAVNFKSLRCTLVIKHGSQ